MTEQDVLDAYRPLLTELIHKYSSYIPSEDALSEAQIVLLLAIRSYQPAFHGAFWADFARPQIVALLRELQKKKNVLFRRERLSLDATVNAESETPFSQFLLIEPPKVTQIELQELLSLAPDTAQQVGWRIIDRYSPAEIQQYLLLSEQEYQHCLSSLQIAWKTYNQENS
ncbi:hypothetical protein [Gemmiger sp.]